jgi:hypothetical protein
MEGKFAQKLFVNRSYTEFCKYPRNYITSLIDGQTDRQNDERKVSVFPQGIIIYFVMKV